jgi:uncharacterized membrane protein
MRTLVILYAIIGVVIALTAVPLMVNMVKPNRFYGFRSRRTLGDPEIWYAGNHYAGNLQFIAGIFTTMFAFVLTLVSGMSLTTYSLTNMIVLLVVLIIARMLSWRYVRSLDE